LENILKKLTQISKNIGFDLITLNNSMTQNGRENMNKFLKLFTVSLGLTASAAYVD